MRRVAPRVDVSLSHEIAPVPGEYERTSTTVINAYALRVTRSYLDNLAALLRASGYEGELLVMQGHGGLAPVAEAAQRPVGMIECGPAAGMIGARYLLIVRNRAALLCIILLESAMASLRDDDLLGVSF